MTPEVKNRKHDAGAPRFSFRRWGSSLFTWLSRWTRANSGALALPEQSRILLAWARLILAILGNGLCRSPLVGELRKAPLAGRHMDLIALRAATELSVFSSAFVLIFSFENMIQELRRVKMAKKGEGILDLLMVLPWWVSVVLSALTYVVLAVIVPSITFESVLFQGLANGASQLALIFALVLLIPAPISAFNSWRKRQLLDQQESIDSIKDLNWKEFEELVAEAYRRKGFRVIENHQLGADGGVDVRLEKGGKTHLIQCKQWKTQKIGVAVIREMFGIMTAEQAASVMIICSGKFTQDAVKFAKDKPIELIEGTQLLELVKSVQEGVETGEIVQESVAQERIQPEVKYLPPKSECPKCGSELLLRKAKKGPNAGKEFFGCSSFPKCRHTQPC